MARTVQQGLLDSKNQEVRGLEEALASQSADRSEQVAAAAARQQDMVRGQADARKALICLKEELAAAQAALQEEHSRCLRLQSNQTSAQQVNAPDECSQIDHATRHAADGMWILKVTCSREEFAGVAPSCMPAANRRCTALHIQV